MTRGSLKVWDATYVPLDTDVVEVVPVAASSIIHAVRKAALQESDKGELISLVKTDRIII